MRIENPRLDIASRERMDKAHLFRLCVDPRSSKLILDKGMNLPGRGIYLARSLEAIEMAIKKHRFDRYGGLSDELLAELKEELRHD